MLNNNELQIEQNGVSYSYSIARVQIDNSVLTAFFDKSVMTGENRIVITTMTERVDIDLSTEEAQLQEAINTINNSCLHKLQARFEQSSEIVSNPDFLGFYKALTISGIFAYANQKATESLNALVAYTDFSSALNMVITNSGHGSSTSVDPSLVMALQSATYNLLNVLNIPEGDALLTETQILIEQFNIPLSLVMPE